MKVVGDAACLLVMLVMSFSATLAILEIGHRIGQAARAFL